jgi:hypothetical protein
MPDGEVEHGGWRGFLFGHVVCLLEKICFLRSLTRRRRQFVVYFCLHRAKFAGKHGKIASFSSEHKPRPNCEWGILDWFYFDLRIGSAAISLRGSFALDSRQPACEYHCVGHFHVNPDGCRA